MESVIERIEQGDFWKYHGGIHPPEMKFLTTDKPIRPLAIPKELVLPIQQHIGNAGELLVKVGDSVVKGQPLTASSSMMAVPVHAPTSGTISAIEQSIIAHPSGLSDLCIKITPDGEDKWRERHITPNYQALSKTEILDKIINAGISGMGGAGFPTHVKVNTSAQINYLIINASECEPYITADDLLIREQCSAIVDGIKILDQLLEPAFILIGIEDNKPEAIKTLQKETQHIEKIKVCVLPTKYPTGGEKQLIMALTGIEVPTGVIPNSLGIVMQNIATCFAIADAVIHDTPLIKRVITVSGQSLEKPQNVWALLGTPVEFLLSQCGYPEQDKKHIIMGGPMMGFSLPNTKVPVIKTTNCILAPSEDEIPNQIKEVECIRCGQCAEVCPSQLLPQDLQWSAKAQDHQQLNKLNLFDCIECGACAYVCPSHIPLVHYYRIAKAEIRQQNLLDIQAEKAKLRFEARKARLERDKIAREEKHKKAAAARQARMNAGTVQGNQEKSAVAAALARVKAKKSQANKDIKLNDNEEQPQEIQQNDKKSQVAAAIARAKAKKLAAQKIKETQTTADTKQVTVSQEQLPAKPANKAEDKKSKIASAVAKAKAKKAASSADAKSLTHSSNEIKQSSDDKQTKIAAAVAKAKTKKQLKSTQTQHELTPDENNQSVEKEINKTQDVTDKKARIAAAVAKAKAKKKQAESK